MARKKNATFIGSTPFDVDVDALTLEHTIENAVGNAALVYDMLTGENGEANTIRHIGGGRGCPLGVPLWQQHIGRSLNYRGVGSVKGGVPGGVWLAAHPFFMPNGETALTIQVYAQGPFDTIRPTIRVTSTTGADIVSPTAMVRIDGDDDGIGTFEVRLSGLTAGLKLLFLEANTEDNSTSNIELLSWHGVFDRRRPASLSPMRSVTGSQVHVATPSATEGVVHVNFQDTTFYPDAAIDAYMTTYLDRNLNGLEEFGSGWPAGGNASYTHVDHDGAGAPDASDPARSRFHAGTQSLYANEPELDFPLVAGACGAIGQDGKPVIDPSATAPTSGMLSWFAPYPTTAASLLMHRIPVRMPDFQTTSSKLKWAVLAVGEPISGTDDLTDWQMTVDTGSGASAATSFGAMFSVGPSPTWFALATGTALAFAGDAAQTITLTSSKAIAFGATYTEFFLLGYCFYWEP